MRSGEVLQFLRFLKLAEMCMLAIVFLLFIKFFKFPYLTINLTIIFYVIHLDGQELFICPTENF